jgi:hypothetical protein
MRQWIGVDLDGTLAEFHGWQKDGSIGKPVPAMVARVKQWLAEGKEVRIFTARIWPWGTTETVGGQLVSNASQQIDQINQWCIAHIGVTLPVTCVKDFGMVELWDDRAVQVRINTGELLGESTQSL